MTPERQRITALFEELCRQPKVPFPKPRQKLEAPWTPGVYVIHNRRGNVMHVGRTTYSGAGLRGRLYSHLAGKSSFVYYRLKGDGSRLRNGFTFQFLSVKNPRQRALLEAMACAWLCPAYLGVGKRGEPAV